MIEFEESGMRFAFEKEKSFHIESSSVYRRLSSKGVKSVECITMRTIHKEKNVLLIEAKRSTPNPEEPASDVSDFLDSICRKNKDSLQLCYASLHGIWDAGGEIGPDLAQALRERPQIKCVLIVKGYETEWCQNMTELLRDRLYSWLRMWKAEVWVLTEAQAQKAGLIQRGEE